MNKSKYAQWYHPYKPDSEYNKRSAYFSMEFGIDQALKTYSGGLGFLAGSHMKSAYELKQNLIGIGILWKYGYYDQNRNLDMSLRADYSEKHYDFLEDTGIILDLKIFKNPHVKAKVWVLKPETFQTVPIYFLSTDLPENDHLSRTISNHLYDDNVETRIAQSMLLGVGGAKLIDVLGGTDFYHLNEGHGLPAFTYLMAQSEDKEALKEKFVFTTHTPEAAGNEERSLETVVRAGFFDGWAVEDVQALTRQTPDRLNYTLAALRMAKYANAVSKMHGDVANDMWKDYEGICPITYITNAQNATYWSDAVLQQALQKNQTAKWLARKKEMKKELFEVVADQCGKIFDPEVLTLVWARRFAAYKRPDLLIADWERFYRLATNTKRPIQIIWAGKPYPKDHNAIGIFNRLVYMSKDLPNCAVLLGYELKLSRLLKNGCDLWLNTPRKTREASGTSGMTAAMNAAVNLSIIDGWMYEFGKHGHNCFLIPDSPNLGNNELLDIDDNRALMSLLENEILPMYYDKPIKWQEIARNSMTEVHEYFNSHRMADEYYTKLYAHQILKETV